MHSIFLLLNFSFTHPFTGSVCHLQFGNCLLLCVEGGLRLLQHGLQLGGGLAQVLGQRFLLIQLFLDLIQLLSIMGEQKKIRQVFRPLEAVGLFRGCKAPPGIFDEPKRQLHSVLKSSNFDVMTFVCILIIFKQHPSLEFYLNMNCFKCAWEWLSPRWFPPPPFLFTTEVGLVGGRYPYPITLLSTPSQEIVPRALTRFVKASAT